MEQIFGLLGRRLGHSWSPAIHAALGCPDYRLFPLEPEELPGFLARPDIGGLNVTIPYKQTVMAWCDEIDPAARAIGSVNTLVRGGDGKLRAWNTDAMGLAWMAERAGLDFAGKKVAILGSGGASLTAQAVARSRGARSIAVISRSGEDNYQNLSRHADAELIINATPVGMYPDNGSAPVDLRDFPACQGVLDLIYNPQRTALLLQAEELGLPCSDGLPMLVAQAKAAEELFFGTSIPDERCEAVLGELRRQQTNLVLIGMPGCGKTTVGQALARLTDREAVDIDEAVAARAGCSIPELFAREGEAAFRALEREEIAAAGARSGLILITGGGAVKDRRNLASLRQNGRIYHLERRLELLATEGRPLSQSGDLEQLWAERAPLYAAFRDVRMDNNGPAEDTARAIWRDFLCAY
jgi:shikimate dehydrogenase